MLKSIQLITGLLLVLITGVFWGTWFSLSRSMYELPPEMFIAIGKEIIKNVAVPMSIIMPASLLGLLILLIQSWKIKSIYFYCVLISLILFITVLLITVGVEVPADNQIKTWTLATIPADWQSIRDRWETFHTLRTLISLAGIISFLIALLNRNEAREIGRAA